MRIDTRKPHALPPHMHLCPGDSVRIRNGREWVSGTVQQCNSSTAEVSVGGDPDRIELWQVGWSLLRPGNPAVARDCKTRAERVSRLGRHAEELIARHGLRGWQFRWDMAQRRGGNCNYTRRRIQLSLGYALAVSDEEVEDTILHEIAHGLAGYEHGHDAVWRATARSIGCSAKVCHDTPFRAPKWKGTCLAGCAEVKRLRRARLVCRKCGGRILWSRILVGDANP